MTFGICAGKQPSHASEHVMDFIHDRSTNFINNNDPCARAWSALDLKQFLLTVVEAVKKEKTSGMWWHQSIAFCKVADTAAQVVLHRDDFPKLEKLAAQFKHFAKPR